MTIRMPILAIAVAIWIGLSAVSAGADGKDDAIAKAVEKLGGKCTRDPMGQILTVDLRRSKVTDADLKQFKELKSLNSIMLGNSTVGDAGIKELLGLKTLTFVGLLRTKVTAQGVADLQKALPNAGITSNFGQSAGRNRQRASRPARRGAAPEEPQPTEFDATIYKAASGLVAFSVFNARGGAAYARTQTLPTGNGARIFLGTSGIGSTVIQKGAEAPGGLENERFQLALASREYGVPAHIHLDAKRQKIEEIWIAIPDKPEELVDVSLHPPAGPARALDDDPLPAHAIARLGTLRFRHALPETRLLPDTDASVAVSPDGQFLATCRSDIVQLWNPLTGERVTKLALHGPDDPPSVALNGVQELAFSADGARLAIVRGPNRLRILTDMGRKSHEIEFAVRQPADVRRGGRGGTVQRRAAIATPQWGGVRGPSSSFLSFLPGGHQLIVNQLDNPLLRLLDVESGKEIRTFGDANQLPNAVALSVDGLWLALAEGPDGLVKILDVATGAERLRIMEPSGPCSAVAFSPDDKFIATASTQIHFWDSKSGKAAHEPAATGVEESARGGGGAPQRNTNASFQDRVSFMQFSRDGTQVMACNRRKISFLNPSSGVKLRQFIGNFDSARLMSDGATFFTMGPNSFQFYDAASGKAIRQFQGHQSSIEAVAFAPDGEHVATGGQEDGVRIWNIHSRKLELKGGQTGRGRGVYCLAYAPKGDSLAGDIGPNIVVWDTHDGRKRSQVRAHLSSAMGAYPTFAISPDGADIGFANALGWASLVRLGDGSIRKDMYLGDRFRPSAAVSPGLRWLVSRRGIENRATREASLGIWDFETGKEWRKIAVPIATNDRLLFSADSRTLVDLPNVIQNGAAPVLVYETLTGRQRISVPTAGAQPAANLMQAAAFSPDGRLLALADTWRELRSAQRNEEGPTEYRIRIFHLATGRMSAPLSGHEGKINALAFSADSKFLVSGSSDTTALIWDLAELFPAQETKRMSDDEREACWRKLGEDAQVAYQNMWKLVDDPQSVEMIKKELEPVKDRIEVLLDPLTPDQLRRLRAIEVLENMNTPKARELIETLAKGFKEAYVAQEAARSLARLQARAKVSK